MSRGGELRRRLRAAPLAVHLLLGALIFIAVGFLAGLLSSWATDEPPDEPWWAVVARQAIVGVLVVGFLRWLGRRAGGPQAAALAQRVIRRRRVLPQDESEILRPALLAARNLTAALRWWGPGFLLAVAVLLGFLAVAGRQPFVPGTMAALVAGSAVGTLLICRARLGIIDELLADLDERTGGPR